MQFLGVVDAFVGAFELLDFLEQLGFGLYVGEHLPSDQHFVEYQTCAPDVATLVVLFEFQNLWGCVEGSTGAFGHLYLYVSGQSEICDFEFFVFVEQDVVWF